MVYFVVPIVLSAFLSLVQLVRQTVIPPVGDWRIRIRADYSLHLRKITKIMDTRQIFFITFV